MEWTGSIKAALAYMETHLLEDISAKDVAGTVHISEFYLQQGFRVMTGYSIGEYIRNRRLYLAGLETLTGTAKVIDLALRYGYDTPESFTKAFRRFHGVSPAQVRGDVSRLRLFLPLKVYVQIQGGNEMELKIEKEPSVKLIGFAREFAYETSYQEIPKFWSEIRKNYYDRFCKQGDGQTDDRIRKAFFENGIGEFGLCMEEGGPGTFRYMIAGRYRGGEIPEEMTVYELPELTWAKFRCEGPMPGALQRVNDEIFREWLPGNPDYEMSCGLNIEWYSKGDTGAPDYESAIWIPVKKKEAP